MDRAVRPGEPANLERLTYVITVSRHHVLPAQMCIKGLRQKTSARILVVGNLEPNEVGAIRSLGVEYMDEREIDVSGRLPHLGWHQKFREVGWYRQMFFRLCVDRYVETDQAVILDSEVFVFENWDESRFYDPDTCLPRCFYWIPATRKPDWDYRMYRGSAYLLQGLPGFEDVLAYANSDEYQRHISGVVLFSTANVRELWRRLEADTDLAYNLDQLFNHQDELAFSDHDLYGIACERGLFEDIVPTVMHDNLLGWYDTHDDPHFEPFREGAMWSMCQRYADYPTPNAYRGFMLDTAESLKTTLPISPATTPRKAPTTPQEPPPATDALDESGIRNRIAGLARELPEIYQPIFGHPEIVASRSPDDHRIDVLCRAVHQISSHLNRPLRILDLGSAQGYVAFRLAQLGHRVTGIDSLPVNIALAQMIQAEHPGLDVEFLEGDIVDCRHLVDLRDFDLVIAFSVLHHVAHRDGHSSAVELISTLSEQVPHGLFEMAMATEPVFWAESLPADPRVTLAPYPFIRELGLVGTHLSEVRRPILFASTTCVLAKGELHDIESWKEHSHADAQHLGLRRYFFVASGLVKVTARFVEPVDEALIGQLQQEMRREAYILDALAVGGIEAPAVMEFIDGADESVLFRTAYPGVPLSEIALSTDKDVKLAITGQVLEALAELEAHGLYHGDLRSWNVIWDSDEGRAHLIDHGALSPLPGDTMWPNDAYFSFLVWLVSLWGSYPDQTGLQFPRRAGIDRAEFPPRIVALFSALMVHARDGRVFRDLSRGWAGSASGEATALWPATPVAWDWLSAIERFAQTGSDALAADRDALASERDALASERATLASERDALASERDALTSERDTLASERDRLASELDALRALCDVLRAELGAAETRADTTQAELARTLNTQSWRLTRPLRRLRSTFRR